MKTNRLLISSVVLLFCLVCWKVYGQQQASSKATWEYLVKTESALNQQYVDLRALGAEGWELTAVTQRDQITGNNLLDIERRFYFKRQR
jgi:hypothetical protein